MLNYSTETWGYEDPHALISENYRTRFFDEQGHQEFEYDMRNENEEFELDIKIAGSDPNQILMRAAKSLLAFEEELKMKGVYGGNLFREMKELIK